MTKNGLNFSQKSEKKVEICRFLGGGVVYNTSKNLRFRGRVNRKFAF